MGSRRTKLVWVAWYSYAALPSRWRTCEAKKRRLSDANAKSLSRRSLYEVPVWSVSSRASSSAWSSTMSASRFRIETRSARSIRCHRPSANAARAAATARSTSAGVPAGTRPTSSPVAGLLTSIHSSDEDSAGRPSMNIGRSTGWWAGAVTGRFSSVVMAPSLPALTLEDGPRAPLVRDILERRVDQAGPGVTERALETAAHEPGTARDPQCLVGRRHG